MAVRRVAKSLSVNCSGKFIRDPSGKSAVRLEVLAERSKIRLSVHHPAGSPVVVDAVAIPSAGEFFFPESKQTSFVGDGSVLWRVSDPLNGRERSTARIYVWQIFAERFCEVARQFLPAVRGIRLPSSNHLRYLFTSIDRSVNFEKRLGRMTRCSREMRKKSIISYFIDTVRWLKSDLSQFESPKCNVIIVNLRNIFFLTHAEAFLYRKKKDLFFREKYRFAPLFFSDNSLLLWPKFLPFTIWTRYQRSSFDMNNEGSVATFLSGCCISASLTLGLRYKREKAREKKWKGKYITKREGTVRHSGESFLLADTEYTH